MNPMKHIFVYLVAMTTIVAISSCQKTREERVSELVGNEIKKTLLYPESYESVELEIDSAFTPFDDPEFFDMTFQLGQYSFEIENAESDMKSAKSSMAIWSGPYQSAFGKTQYQEAKDDYDAAYEKKEEASQKAEALVQKMKTILDKEPEFIGYKVRHKFRASKEQGGERTFGEYKFLFTEDLSSLVAQWNMNDMEYIVVRRLYKEIQDARSE